MNALTYHFKFHKHQSTRGGGPIPYNADNYMGSEVTVTGLSKKFSVAVAKSSLRRLLTSKQLKDKIPAPYFMNFNYTPDNNFVDELVRKILDDKIVTFKLSNGTLTCTMHTRTEEPLTLIADMEKLMTSWM